MPAADTQQRQAGLPLVPGLLWSGVGLAPVAALLVLFGGDRTGLIRLAVLLAVVAMALIGVSFALRRDPDTMRDQIEDMVFQELDVLRDDMREDITTAARATHKAFGERVVSLQESVESLRGEFENLRVRVERGGAPSQSIPAPGTAAPVPPSPVVPGPGVVGPHGVVRHTETVKVTTRQTIVDQNDRASTTGTVYGGGRAGGPPVVPTQRRSEHGGPPPRGGERHDEPRYGDVGYGETRYGEDRSGEQPWSGDVRDGRRRAQRPEEEHSGRITGVQAGDRWASVRSDDRGHEMRMGERRTAMHADGSGTEVRIEDRWAAVRRDESRGRDARRQPEQSWDHGRGAEWGREPHHERQARPEESWSDPRYGQARGDDRGNWSEPRRDRPGPQPALPAVPSEPSASAWMQDWEAQAESAHQQQRHGGDAGYGGWNGRDEDPAPARSPRARAAGYDTGQERWR
ncbi:hypothetical protein [Planosporangium mesophilum]|uniref:Uncharacterized protein n=1 Tax=Planosporangium mesophilum TaxID=689768 RepID=A0A8J3TPT8_9ACTN|nr:hypothetical protein [Planosporangium mesophilum]NJC83832.1 hypothetical protein [Planosporangium mesophilum]GII25170.1 hypothetical protein Pme01_47670 [Planosporangium mesophilum]